PALEVHTITDVNVRGVHGVMTQRDLVVGRRRATGDDRRLDRTAYLGETPQHGPAPVDFAVGETNRPDIGHTAYSLDPGGVAVALRPRLVTGDAGLHVPGRPVARRARDETVKR